MRVIRKLSVMGWLREAHGWHMSSMLAGQEIRWKILGKQVNTTVEDKPLGPGIKAQPNYACSGGFWPDANSIAIVMAGKIEGMALVF